MFGRSRERLVCLVLIRLLALGGHLAIYHVDRQAEEVEEPPTLQVEGDKPGLTMGGFSNEADPSASTSPGVFFQQEGCPYSISEQEAADLFNSTSEHGNVISVEHFGVGRTGNRFESLSVVLSMGYCCRSRLVSLPPNDDQLPRESTSQFQANQRHFRFSQATLPSDKYMGLRDDPTACKPILELNSHDAFYLSGFSKTLMACTNDVYVRGCERAFLGPGLDKEVICPKRDLATQTGAGTLVIHMRSGDIMKTYEEGEIHFSPGQPPLQFYLHAINEKRWEAVTVLTWTMNDALLNPAYTALEMMANTGTLGRHFQFYRNRTIWEDLREMICADGLVTARSSLSFPMIALSGASFYVIPYECGLGRFRRTNGLIAMDRYDNTTLLQAEKPNAEVFGIGWDDGSAEYSVFHGFNPNDCAQRMEMVAFGGVKKIQKCD